MINDIIRFVNHFNKSRVWGHNADGVVRVVEMSSIAPHAWYDHLVYLPIGGGEKRRIVTRQRTLLILTLGLVWLAAFSCRTTIVTIGPLLPVFLKSLGLRPFWAGSLTALPLLIIAVVSIPSGRVADRLGQRTTLILALAVLSLGCYVPLVSPTQTGLFLNVSATGLGIGLAQPTLAKLARSLNPDNPTIATTLYANALVAGGFIASLTTAPLILPWLGGHWARVLAFWGSIAVITTVGWLFISQSMRESRNESQPPKLNAGQFIAQPGFYPIAAAFAAQGAVFYALVTWLPDYFVRQGWSLAHASYPLAVVSLGSILGGLTSPFWLRWGRGFRRPFLLISVLMAIAVAGLAVLPSWAYVWSLLIGATTAIIFTLGMAAPAEMVAEGLVGRASGTLLAIGYVGAVVGPLGYGALVPLGHAVPIAYLVLMTMICGGAALAIPARLSYQSSASQQSGKVVG